MNLDNITQFKFHFNLNVSQFNSEYMYNQYFVAPLELSFPLTITCLPDDTLFIHHGRLESQDREDDH